MRDAVVSALSVIALIAVSVGVGEIAFLGHHQVFVGETVPGTR